MTTGGPTVMRLTYSNIPDEIYKASMVLRIVTPLARFTGF
jgi:hypothetical protein